MVKYAMAVGTCAKAAGGTIRNLLLEKTRPVKYLLSCHCFEELHRALELCLEHCHYLKINSNPTNVHVVFVCTSYRDGMCTFNLAVHVVSHVTHRSIIVMSDGMPAPACDTHLKCRYLVYLCGIL